MSKTFTSESVLDIEREQCEKLSFVPFSQIVSHIYNPLDYASETHQDYVRNYCADSKAVLFLGMNPGPFGMAQNGVPFGDSKYVNNWLRIKGKVNKPYKEHPKRLIQGLNCSRSEVSGSRFWSLFEELCETPEKFFKNCYVHNYCPLSMMTKTGKNITPPDLKNPERQALYDICDESLIRIIKLLNVKHVVGVGKFAEVRTKQVLKFYDITDVTVEVIMHPSPINPAANQGWKDIVLKQMETTGIINYLR